MTTPADREDLITWLRAQLDDDERLTRKARAVAPGGWVSTYRNVHAVDPESGATSRVLTAESGALAWHAARYDPARALAEVDAKRRILDDYERYAAERRRVMNGWESSREVSPILAALALPYADRPGYREEWRPA